MPTGSEVQIDAARNARNLFIVGEAVLTILTPIAIGLLPPEFAPIIIKVYTVQLIAAGILAFGYLEPRLNQLQKMRSDKNN